MGGGGGRGRYRNARFFLRGGTGKIFFPVKVKHKIYFFFKSRNLMFLSPLVAGYFLFSARVAGMFFINLPTPVPLKNKMVHPKLRGFSLEPPL